MSTLHPDLRWISPSPALYALALIPILYLLRRPLLALITPKGVPGIPAYGDASPIFGDMARLGRVMKETNTFTGVFDQASKDLGPIAQIRVGYIMNLVCLSDYQEIENLLTRPREIVDRSFDTIRIFKHILPRALLTLKTNDMYKHHRRLIGTAMSSKYLAQSTPKAVEAIEGLVKYWKTKSALVGEKGFSADSDLEGAAMDAISAMAFGQELGIIATRQTQVAEKKKFTIGELGEAVFETENPPVADSIMHIFATLPVRSATPALSHFITRQTPSYRRHASRLEKYLQSQLLASRSRAKQMGADVAIETADNTLDLMVARELKGDDFMIESEMRDELYQYLLAGTETSATTLSWWVKYMTNFPDIQRKLRQHVLDKLPEIQDRAPTFDDVGPGKLPYLEAVVQETLRLSRTAGGYSREIIQDTVILGHFIPKGTVVIMGTNSGLEDASSPLYSLGGIDGKAPQSYPSPASSHSSLPDSDEEGDGKLSSGTGSGAKAYNASLATKRSDPSAERKVGYWKAGSGRNFDPERWLRPDGSFDPNAGPSLPFSVGQRSCFGKNLALLEMRMFIMLLNQAFFFVPVTETQNVFTRHETVTSHPDICVIRPFTWTSPEASNSTTAAVSA